MNSIQKQQEGDHREDLSTSSAVEKIRELVDNAQSCFFCTRLSTPGALPTRPMAVQKVDDEGRLWFLSADDSFKNREIEEDPAVQLFFQGSAHSDFLTLSGTATANKDKQKIEELWNPMIKTWFTEGKDDPRISVICFEPTTGYYWDNKHGNVVAFVKQLAGAAMGKTMDDSVEGRISV